MPHTVHVVCDATGFDGSITVPDDALVCDLLIEAGLTDPVALLNYSSQYYQGSQLVSASILLPVARIPSEEILFFIEREY